MRSKRGKAQGWVYFPHKEYENYNICDGKNKGNYTNRGSVTFQLKLINTQISLLYVL
jgi:hypothetical protein